jgi:hypothetical protein
MLACAFRAIGRGPAGLLLFFWGIVFVTLAPISIAQADDAFPRLKALIESGQYHQAREFAAHASPDMQMNRLSLAFANALILKNQGRFKEAAAAMRAILSDNPNFTRVRVELADTLFHMGDMDGAKFNFQLLADSSSDTTQRNFYDSCLTAIRQKRPWTLDAYVAIAPSTNINNGISGNTVIIGDVPFDASTHAGKSGIGAAYGVAGTYRFDLAPHWDLTVGAKGNGNLYSDDVFDQSNGSAFTALAYSTRNWSAALGLTADRTLIGWQGFEWDFGPQLSLTRNFGPLGTLVVTVGWKQLTYDQVNAYDGSESDLGLHYLKSLSPSSSIGLGMLFSDVTADVSFKGYERYRPSIDIYKELPWGLLASAAVGYELRDYKSDFPLMGTPRADRELDLDLAVTFRNLSWHGFAPKVEYTYSHNDSNVQLYTYDSQAIGFYITKQY